MTKVPYQRSKKYLIKDLKKVPYQGTLIKDLKSVLSRYLIKDLKSTLSRYLNKGSKNCLNQGSKNSLNQASLRELIYAFLLASSKTCDLSLIKKRDVQYYKI